MEVDPLHGRGLVPLLCRVESMAPFFKPRFLRFLFACALFSIQIATGQGLSSLVSANKPAAATQTENDPLKRTTPRSSIYNFLQTCHDDKPALAAQYLELPRNKQSQGAELAKQLSTLLDRDQHFEVNHLSNSPEGNRTDGLPPDLDNLDTFQLNG